MAYMGYDFTCSWNLLGHAIIIMEFYFQLKPKGARQMSKLMTKRILYGCIILWCLAKVMASVMEAAAAQGLI